MTPGKNRPIELLMVEDNPADVRLTIEALAEEKVANHLQVAKDGIEALEILQQKGDFRNAPRPDLILLDLNLPRMCGHEVLAFIKGDETLKRIPVVVLTTSGTEEEILRSYNLHASCHILKPVELAQFTQVVKIIEGFWLRVASLPES